MQSHLNKIKLTKEFLESALNENLPGKKAHQTMMPKGRSLSIPKNEKKIKRSAVLILIYPEQDELQFCLTKRNEKLKHHPGQISFPGGKCESYEINPLDTALRETEEEIGVHPSDVKILGKLSELYISVSKFKIHPFVAWTPKKPIFNINRIEVDELISLPLNTILNKTNKTIKTVKTVMGRIDVPCYFIGDKLVWGATSMMLAELELILRKHYSHQESRSNNDDIDQ